MNERRVLTAGQLTIDLRRLRENYRIIGSQLDGQTVAAMVKANGYGLGAVQVAESLWGEGCRVFFVAQIAEAIAVRQKLPEAQIHVLNGAMPGVSGDLVQHSLIPVLNSLEQVSIWTIEARRLERRLSATVHFDTGMSRLGLAPDESETLLSDLSLLEPLHIEMVMSHLASADVPTSDQSLNQLERFRQIRSRIPVGSASLANSAGIFLDRAYHFDVVRPGIALYGGTPLTDGSNPMKQVATLEAPIVQVRNVDAGEVVGYGATHTMERSGRVATISTGYADGFLRSSSGRGRCFRGEHGVPIIGRVSMDLITLDVTDVPPDELYLGAPVQLVGDRCPIDDVAARAGSIANELLTDFGARYQRTYVG